MWRCIDTGARTGAFNMEYDKELAAALLSEVGDPTLRFFRWKPWALSLGFNQNIEEINVEKCREDGIDVVRRPTGGRAILHAEELTYSVVMPANGKTILDAYNAISQALVTGLSLFGIEASLQKTQPNFAEKYKTPSAIPCFASSARYEIEWRGRKLIGSAQRRYRDANGEVILQHGSILTGPAHLKLGDYIRISKPDILHSIKTEMETKTVDLSEIRGGSVNLQDLSDCIKKGFEKEWEISFAPEEINFQESVVRNVGCN